MTGEAATPAAIATATTTTPIASSNMTTPLLVEPKPPMPTSSSSSSLTGAITGGSTGSRRNKHQYSSRQRSSFLLNGMGGFGNISLGGGCKLEESSKPGNRYGANSVMLRSDENMMSMMDMDISRYSQGERGSIEEGDETEYDDDLADFVHARVNTFWNNMDAISGMLVGDSRESDDNNYTRRRSTRISGSGLEGISELDAVGNPQDNSGPIIDGMADPFATFNRNMDTIARRISESTHGTTTTNAADEDVEEKRDSYLDYVLPTAPDLGFTDFLMARMDTFTNNINFAQATAEGMARDLGTMDTFSKNVDYAQSQVESLTRDLGSALISEKKDDLDQNHPQVCLSI